MDINKTVKSSKEMESVIVNIQQDNTEEIDEANDNVELISEEMIITSEKDRCPIETFQAVEIRVIEGNMNIDKESDKTLDSQETISNDTMF